MKKACCAIFALVILSAVLCSCAGRIADAVVSAVEEKMTYEQIRDLSRYKTIVCDGATYRFIESDQDAEDEFSRDGNILLGDEAEYKLADENGVPYDETRSEKGFFFEGDEEKKYIFIPDTATVWTKDGEK